MQVKLLRAIQEKAIRPVGANAEQATDVRLLSATHKNLAHEVEAGRFRNDLFYRINVIDVQVPSLRERIEDVPELAEALLGRIAREEGSEKPRLDKSAITALSSYSFPGNVRELENMLERALALSNDATITAEDLQFASATPRPADPARTSEKLAAKGADGSAHRLDMEAVYGNLEGYLESVERQIISVALEETRWNRTATANLLGISFRSLRYRLKKLGLED
jgi:two-component system response regulator PilR (NtrC family)